MLLLQYRLPFENQHLQSTQSGTLTAGADIFESCDSDSEMKIDVWKQSSESLAPSSSEPSARRTCSLSFHSLGEGFLWGHLDCKWPVLWNLKHSVPLYLQLSWVWFVRPQLWHCSLSPVGWPDFPSLAWPLPRFWKRPRDFQLSHFISFTPPLAPASPPWESLCAASCVIALHSWNVKIRDKSFCLTCCEHSPQIK